MARTFIRQNTQIRKSDVYDDSVVPSATNYETNTTTLEDDLNSLRSQIQNILNRNGSSMPTGNWYDNIVEPSNFEDGKRRGVSEINQQLHNLERKRVLVASTQLTDITVGSGNNFVVLTAPQLPTKTVASVGASSVTGSVVAHVQGTFGAWSEDFVTGSTAIAPKNLCEVVEGDTRDQILSSNRVVYALFQSENSTDGHTLGGSTPNRAQLSFVRINSAGNGLEAVPVADIENKVINYSSVERKALEDLNEQDFLRGAILDNAGTTTLNRQNAYDNQATTPVELTTNAILDINSAGAYWTIRDTGNAVLFKITEGAGTNNSTVTVDADVNFFDVNADDVDFSQGAKFDTGGQQINVGFNTGIIESTSANNLRILGAGELFLDDGNQPGSWAQTDGIKLSETGLEWSVFEDAFDGEVSLLKAIYQSRRRDKVYARVNVPTISANSDVSSSILGSNIDVALPYMGSGSFGVDYDVFLNGQLLRPGANDTTNNDYYPGADQFALRFEFDLKENDVICVVPYVRD